MNWQTRSARGGTVAASALRLATVVIALVLLNGCHGSPTAGELGARRDLQAVGQIYEPRNHPRTLPDLQTNASLGDFLRYAMLNQPQVEAAYFDWAGSVERITVARSLPDPQLTFQSDIGSVVQSVMPGLAMEFPGPGKLKAAASVATAASRSKYYTFEASALEAAFDLKWSYYQLYYLDTKVRVNRQTLSLLSDLEKIARSQNEVGNATLQDVLRAQIEQDRLTTDITNLEDSRHFLVTQFKAALGLRSDQPDPPMPQQFESTPLNVSSDQLLADALANNPRLRELESDVKQAEAALALAQKAKVPDFNVAVQGEVEAAPAFVRPLLGMTLPLWRDKIAAQIAEAHSGRRASQARLSAEQIALAVALAEKTFLYRESTRNVELLTERLLPKAQQSLEVARGAYLSGQLDFLNLIDAERMWLGFQLDEVEARTQRELALAELSLMILGQPPAGMPAVPQ